MRGNEMWRAAASYAGFDEFVLRGTEELPRVGRPQVDYLRAPDREVDNFVGRTETFADDLAHVERRLGGEPVHVPHRNKSPHGSSATTTPTRPGRRSPRSTRATSRRSATRSDPRVRGMMRA